VAVAVVLTSAAVWAGAARGRGDRLLQLMPAETLFCVRVNNLDRTVSQVNAFVRGIAPGDFDADVMILPKLTAMLGAERMKQVRQEGSFAIFGATLPADEEQQGPFANLFVGLFLPVDDYAAFVGGDKPKRQAGIATLRVNGEPKALVARYGRHVLMCSPDARKQLARARRMLREQDRGLRDALGVEEQKLATQSPVWLYGNVEQASALVKPMIAGKLAQIQAELSKAKERSPFGDPTGIITFYAELLNIITEETASVAVGLAPSDETCKVTFMAKAVPGSETASLMAIDGPPALYKDALGHLKDGAVINVATTIDQEALTKGYLRWIELLPRLIGAEVPAAELDRLRELTRRSFRAMGDSASFTFSPGAKKEGFPFAMEYVFAVKDGAVIEKALAEELELTNSDVFKSFFKNFGFKMRASVEDETAPYKDVAIHSANVAFEMEFDDSPPAQMMKKMWSDGIAYRWAVVGDRCAYTIGQEADVRVRGLIDLLQTGRVTGVCSEIRAAMEAIPESAGADAVGTFNYVRMLNAVLGGMPLPEGAKLPELNAPTENSIAFAGRTGDGRFTAWVAVPKQHVIEIKSAFETLGKHMEKTHQQTSPSGE
jgi:hypothetical protein